jgi:hypothetical protein
MWIAIGRNIYIYPGEPWGFDNGAFRYWHRKPAPMEPADFDGVGYRERLARALDVPGPPLLAVVPDLPGSPDSLEFSLRWRDSLPAWPWYLAVQDGTDPAHVHPYVSHFAGIFLGGTDRYKARAREWANFARDLGMPLHYGRAGTLAKLDHAEEVGADSLDSAFPLWTERRLRDFVLRWAFGTDQLSVLRERVDVSEEASDE